MNEPYARYKDKEKRKQYNREYQREYMRKHGKSLVNGVPRHTHYYRKLKQRAFAILGGSQCAECGCTDITILELNHLHGGGRAEGKSTRLLFQDITTGRKSDKDFNVLCRVCNAAHYVRDILGISGHTITWTAS